MGTEIQLEVGGVTVDWAKNRAGTDHGVLYQEKDRKRLRADAINYRYHEEQGLDPAPMEAAFSRPLRSIVPRIELLGFTLATVRREYERRAAIWKEEREYLAEPGDELAAPLGFDELVDFVRTHALTGLNDTFVSGIDRESGRQVKGKFDGIPLTARIPSDSEHLSNAYSERSYFGVLLDFLQPYSLLRLLAENLANLDLEVTWQYGPLVEAGWANADDFNSGVRRTQTILIATEGSSDIHILRRALELLRPDVVDFFRFIDVSERHPFSGTGSLVKFAEGLAKIDVHNQVVFVFDNDAEGADAYDQVHKFKLPSNMRAMLLPELEEFRQFDARGPEGHSKADINRRAAAIECYLDLNLFGHQPACVVWTNYKKDRGVYQGALEFKESYAKAFFDAPTESVQGGNYDVSKLTVLLDSLLAESVRLAEAVRLSTA